MKIDSMNLNVPIGNLDAYIAFANSVPFLTAHEEFELANRLQQHNDLDAARKLVMSQIRYVVRIAQGYKGYGLQLGDLIQEGSIGLMKAVKKFSPDFQVRLVSFAVHWIKAEIHEFIIKNWKIVKIATTKAQRKLFFNLRNMKKRLGWMHAGEINIIAKDLGVDPSEVIKMEERLYNYDESFDVPSNPNEQSPSEYLPSKNFSDKEEEQESFNKIAPALSTLDERSQEILQKRYLSPSKATFKELSSSMGISAERIRQIETKAILKIKNLLS